MKIIHYYSLSIHYSFVSLVATRTVRRELAAAVLEVGGIQRPRAAAVRERVVAEASLVQIRAVVQGQRELAASGAVRRLAP